MSRKELAWFPFQSGIRFDKMIHWGSAVAGRICRLSRDAGLTRVTDRAASLCL